MNNANGTQCQTYNSFFYCQCTSGNFDNFPDFNFIINGQNYSIPASMYVSYQPTMTYSDLTQRNLQMVPINLDNFMEKAQEESEASHFAVDISGEYTSDSSWDPYDSGASWDDDTWTYDYDSYWNDPYFYYSSWYWGWGYGYYPYYWSGPIIVNSYDYYTDPSNPDQITPEKIGDTCQLKFSNAQNYNSSSSNFTSSSWILGLPFLQSYYVSFDANNASQPTVSFADSNQPFHYWKLVSTPSTSSSSHWWVWLVIALAVIIFVGAAIYCYKNKDNLFGSSDDSSASPQRKKKKGKKGKKKHQKMQEETEIIVTTQTYPQQQGYIQQGYPAQSYPVQQGFYQPPPQNIKPAYNPNTQYNQQYSGYGANQ